MSVTDSKYSGKIVVGNKIDLLSELTDVVTEQEGREFAEDIDADFILTSAQSG